MGAGRGVISHEFASSWTAAAWAAAARELCVWFVVSADAACDYKILNTIKRLNSIVKRVFVQKELSTLFFLYLLISLSQEAHFQFCFDYELMPESDIWWWWWWLCGEIVVTSIGKCLAPGQGCVCGLAPGVRLGQGKIFWKNENYWNRSSFTSLL